MPSRYDVSAHRAPVLPALCADFCPVIGKPILILRHVGYKVARPDLDVNFFNAMLGVTPPQRSAMFNGVNWGWRSDLAYPEHPTNLQAPAVVECKR